MKGLLKRGEKIYIYTGVGKSRSTVVCMGKDRQVVMITKGLLTLCFIYSQL